MGEKVEWTGGRGLVFEKHVQGGGCWQLVLGGGGGWRRALGLDTHPRRPAALSLHTPPSHTKPTSTPTHTGTHSSSPELSRPVTATQSLIALFSMPLQAGRPLKQSKDGVGLTRPDPI